MCGAILKAINSSFQKGMTFYRSIHVKKVMKLLAFIFEQSSYQNLSGKTENISVQCSAILFWSRSCDCSVYTTSEDGVLLCTPAQVFQRT